MLTGAELRAIRKKHGLSQRQMAELLEVSSSQLSRLENDEADMSEQVEAGALALDLGEDGPPAFSRENAAAAAPSSDADLDELPAPAYNPAEEQPPSDEDPEPKTGGKTRERRRRGPQRKRMTAWQEETAASFVALIQGETTPMELNGEPVLDPVSGQQIVVFVPGIAWMVGQVDAFDGMVLHQGSPALAQALVKLAPRHPFLKGFLDVTTAGDEYRELFAAVAGIVGPIAAHHGMLPTLGGGIAPAAAAPEGEAVRTGANGGGPH